MTHIQLETKADKYLISIDKATFNREWVAQLIEKLRIEELAKQFDFDEDIEAVGEQIKADWWAKNKARFIHE